MTRDTAAGHFEADELARHRRGLHPLERGATDEVARMLGRAELHHPAESGFQGIRRLVDVVAVERQAPLEAERVAGAETDRLEADPRALARLHEGAPHGGRVVPGAEDLDAVFARVAGPRDGARDACERRVGEPERTEARQRSARRTERREDLESARALQRDERRLVALVYEVAVVLRGPREVRAHLGAVRRVADDEPVVLGLPVHDEVVEDRPLLVAGAGVHGLAVDELLRVVRDQMIDDVRRELAP